MTLVRDAVRAALCFVPLHKIPEVIGRFVEHLGRSHKRTRPKKIELFQQELKPAPG